MQIIYLDSVLTKKNRRNRLKPNPSILNFQVPETGTCILHFKEPKPKSLKSLKLQSLFPFECLTHAYSARMISRYIVPQLSRNINYNRLPTNFVIILIFSRSHAGRI